MCKINPWKYVIVENSFLFDFMDRYYEITFATVLEYTHPSISLLEDII